jgi:serine/threonine protein phosphatase PrpC
LHAAITIKKIDARNIKMLSFMTAPKGQPMQTDTSGYSDKGMVRDGNEDSFVVAPEIGFFAVADGMGGHNAGEVASRMAIDALRAYLERTAIDGSLPGSGKNPDCSDAANLLACGIRHANRVIYESTLDNPAWRDMGTTIVAAILNEDRLSIAHVGDSRAYLLRGGGIIALTEDHSLVAEQVRSGHISHETADVSSQRNIITRALGSGAEPEVDLCDLLLAPEDRILLCSDGLTTMVTEAKIRSIVLGSRDPDAICRLLVEEANNNGGKDNITVAVILVRGGALSGLSRIYNWARSI